MGNQNAAGIIGRVKKDRIEPLPKKVCIDDDDDELIFMCQWVKQFVIRNTHQGLRSSERTPEAAAAKKTRMFANWKSIYPSAASSCEAQLYYLVAKGLE